MAVYVCDLSATGKWWGGLPQACGATIIRVLAAPTGLNMQMQPRRSGKLFVNALKMARGTRWSRLAVVALATLLTIVTP